MRISHVVENLNRGGLERVVIDLARAQAASGHDCQVICLFEAGSLASELGAAGIPVVACNKRRGADPRAVLRIRRALNAQQTEVLHSHNGIAHYYSVVAAMGAGVRRVLNTRHGMGDDNPASRREWLFRQSMRRTNVAVAVSEAAGRRLTDIGTVAPEKLRIVPNGIHIQPFHTRNDAARARLATSLGLPADTRLLGFVGRLNWAKDVESLVVAFAKVREQRNDTAMVLVGEGEERATIQAAIDREGLAGSVFMLGDRADVPDLLPAFSMFAMSSISEGYSIALLEACASALPIVATDVGGNREIVSHGTNGLLVPSRQPEAMAAAILALLADEAQASAMGHAGLKWLLSNAVFDVMSSRYLSLYADTRA